MKPKPKPKRAAPATPRLPNGRWRKGVSGNPAGRRIERPPASSAEVDQLVASTVNVEKLVRVLLSSAYQGDQKSIDRVVEALSRREQRADASEAGTITISEYRKLIAYLQPAPEAQDDTDEGDEVDRCTMNVEKPVLAGPTPPPAPEPEALPAPVEPKPPEPDPDLLEVQQAREHEYWRARRIAAGIEQPASPSLGADELHRPRWPRSEYEDGVVPWLGRRKPN
jgi:hypothetical protein